MVHFGAATAMLGGNLEEAYNRYFFDALTKDSFISFDPNYREDLWKHKEDVFIKKCMPFIQKSHLGKFSLEEATLLSGKKDLDEACNFLHQTGVAIIVVTLGKEGTLLSTRDFRKTIPSIEVSPVDTTGAGDAFIGCMLKQIAEHDSLELLLESEQELSQIVSKANKAGAITTTNFGAIESLPTQKQLDS